MYKDTILETSRVKNPKCFLTTGGRKDYSMLINGDEIWIKDVTEKTQPISIKAKIIEWRIPRKIYTYKVETHKGIFWLYPSDVERPPLTHKYPKII